MAITNGYCTLDEIKSYQGIGDSDSDALLEQAVEAASRTIDDHCHRTFYQVTGARYFSPVHPTAIYIDDHTVITEIALDTAGDNTYATVVPTADYISTPRNHPLGAYTYTGVRILPTSTHAFARVLDYIRVTGTWGWSAIPDVIHQAALTLAAKIYHRKDAVFGVTGGDFTGDVMRIIGIDGDVEEMLRAYVRVAEWVA